MQNSHSHGKPAFVGHQFCSKKQQDIYSKQINKMVSIFFFQKMSCNNTWYIYSLIRSKAAALKGSWHLRDVDSAQKKKQQDISSKWINKMVSDFFFEKTSCNNTWYLYSLIRCKTAILMESRHLRDVNSAHKNSRTFCRSKQTKWYQIFFWKKRVAIIPDTYPPLFNAKQPLS